MIARFLIVLLLTGACADDKIVIVRKTLELEQEHTLLVDQSMEYIIQFVPNEEQSRFPMRVWFLSDAGDVTRPLLLTARQRTGAVTWQLPYTEGESLLFELERTLCPDDSVDNEPSDCAGEGEARRGEFSLHVGTSCAAPAALRLRAAPVRDWRLTDSLLLTATVAAPRVHHFQFSEEQASVRLVVASPDDVCATIAVQPYTCPIAQTFADIEQAIPRMTVLRSGGLQLSKARYPRGFYVIALVAETDVACSGEPEEESDWLWESVWQDGEDREIDAAAARRKQLSFEIKPALTRQQYVVGAAVTLALFLLFYVAFGILILAERWPRWYNFVAPRAVLADPNKTEAGALAQLDGARRARRRGSTATFDSSDASDTDSEDEPGAVAASAATDITYTSSGNMSGTTPPNTVTTSPGNTTPGTTSPGNTSLGTTPSNTSPGTTSPGNTTPGPTPSNTSPGTTSPSNTSPGPTSPGNISPRGTVPDAVSPVDVVSDDGLEAAVTNGRIATAESQGEGDAERAEEQGSRARPFGLPVQLRVDALARRRGRVLRARSRRYLLTLYTVAVFYALPVLQFVAAFQVILNVSGSLDLCYYNFLCAHPLGALSDFNHVFSNLGYLLLGALYMLQLRRRKARRDLHPRDEEYGIPAHYGLSSALGAGLMVVALLSASYHVCPNGLNFQFDTAFMYVLAVLSMVKIYQSRHPDINARAHATFGVLAVLILLVVWGVLGGGPLFWSVFTVLHVFTFLLLSLRIYYVGQFRLEKASLAAAAASLRMRGPGARPLYTARLVALLLANAVNWAFAIYGLVEQAADIASHLLFILLCNALLYMVFYLSMKLLHGERPRWYAWLYLAGAAGAWAPALYFFTAGSSDWAATPAQSRLLNHECRVLRFYDSHDLWHLLSAVALYLTFNAMLTWDDGLAAVKRNEIAVF